MHEEHLFDELEARGLCFSTKGHVINSSRRGSGKHVGGGDILPIRREGRWKLKSIFKMGAKLLLTCWRGSKNFNVNLRGSVKILSNM